MEGLFFCHDIDGITFFLFYSDGRVISFGEPTMFDQHLRTFPGVHKKSGTIQFARGIYHVDIWDNIKIIVKGSYGKIVYQDFVKDEKTIDLSYSCPFTNFTKLVTYIRFSKEHHITRFELNQITMN